MKNFCLAMIAMLAMFSSLQAEEWKITGDKVYKLEFTVAPTQVVKLNVPLQSVKHPTSLRIERARGIIYPPAVALGPAVAIRPAIEFSNILTLTLSFREGQLPLQDVNICVWYPNAGGDEPVVLAEEEALAVDHDNATIALHKASDRVHFSWQTAVDPNKDSVFYKVIFTHDAKLQNRIASFDSGENNDLAVSAVNLKTLLKKATILTPKIRDSNARISLYLDTDNKGQNGVLIADNIAEDQASYFDWQVPADFSQGNYYIYGVINDGSAQFIDYSHFKIRVKLFDFVTLT